MGENKEAIESLIKELAKAKIDEKSESFNNIENDIKNLRREITNLELSANVAVYGDKRSAKEKLEEKAQKEALVNQLVEKLNSSKKEIELREEKLINEIDKRINDETNTINSMKVAFFHKSGPDQIVAVPQEIIKREQELHDLISEYDAVKGGQGLEKYVEQEGTDKTPIKEENEAEGKKQVKKAEPNNSKSSIREILEKKSLEDLKKDLALARRTLQELRENRNEDTSLEQQEQENYINELMKVIKEKERVVPHNRQPIQGQAMGNGQPIQGRAMGNGQPLNQVNRNGKKDDSYKEIEKLSIDVDYSNGTPYTGKISYKKGPFGLIKGIMPDPIQEVELVSDKEYAKKMVEYFKENKLSVSEMSKILCFSEEKFNKENNIEKKEAMIENALGEYNEIYDSDILQTIIETIIKQKQELSIANEKFGKDKKDLTYYLIDKFQSLLETGKPGLKLKYRIGKDTPEDKIEKVESKRDNKYVSVRKVLGLFRRRKNTPLLQEAEHTHQNNAPSKGNIREHKQINYVKLPTTRQDPEKNTEKNNKDDLERGE